MRGAGMWRYAKLGIGMCLKMMKEYSCEVKMGIMQHCFILIMQDSCRLLETLRDCLYLEGEHW